MRQSGSAIRRELARREDGWSGLTYGDQPQRDAAQRNLAGMAPLRVDNASGASLLAEDFMDGRTYGDQPQPDAA